MKTMKYRPFRVLLSLVLKPYAFRFLTVPILVLGGVLTLGYTAKAQASDAKMTGVFDPHAYTHVPLKWNKVAATELVRRFQNVMTAYGHGVEIAEHGDRSTQGIDEKILDAIGQHNVFLDTPQSGGTSPSVTMGPTSFTIMDSRGPDWLYIGYSPLLLPKHNSGTTHPHPEIARMALAAQEAGVSRGGTRLVMFDLFHDHNLRAKIEVFDVTNITPADLLSTDEDGEVFLPPKKEVGGFHYHGAGRINDSNPWIPSDHLRIDLNWADILYPGVNMGIETHMSAHRRSQTGEVVEVWE